MHISIMPANLNRPGSTANVPNPSNPSTSLAANFAAIAATVTANYANHLSAMNVNLGNNRSQSVIQPTGVNPGYPLNPVMVPIRHHIHQPYNTNMNNQSNHMYNMHQNQQQQHQRYQYWDSSQYARPNHQHNLSMVGQQHMQPSLADSVGSVTAQLTTNSTGSNASTPNTQIHSAHPHSFIHIPSIVSYPLNLRDQMYLNHRLRLPRIQFLDIGLEVHFYFYLIFT